MRMLRSVRGLVVGIISGIIIWLVVAFLGQVALLTLGFSSADTSTANGQFVKAMQLVIAVSAFVIGALGGIRIGQRFAGPEV